MALDPGRITAVTAERGGTTLSEHPRPSAKIKRLGKAVSSLRFATAVQDRGRVGQSARANKVVME
jgi:hypothetical protein